jgi:hypothetical protein
VGLLAQYPPSTSFTSSPAAVATVFGEKKGKAEHEACTASPIFTPKPGLNVPFRPWACSMLPLNIIGRSITHFVVTMPTAVFTSSNLASP